ncbi:bifunctional 4-hydroxy-2-oxoglutarate aldolase/2-dehydro-3-deoxy-phosphogluconate aldolase, partial [candidate division KSB1 bacterium]|nr:bifunctional 4-hydroxy-2-oxoglutarate aldolase/2-dehydro-3-deoxy-phosphogluconate aldolase [candidate division KSB1 bacterium]
MQAILTQIEEFGVLPVIKIDAANDAVPLAQALINGGLPAAEVTFRTSAAEAAIQNITAAFPEMLVGAGTVLTPEQARIAIKAGAKFIVAPGFNPAVVDFCLAEGVPMTPGICTPTELEAALAKGLKTLKFFPAEEMGGLPYLKSMSAPYSGVKFIPTGGIDAANLLDYLKFNKVLACGGSWMVKADLISAKKFDVITQLVTEAVHTILGFRILQVSLPVPARVVNSAESLLGTLFHLPMKRTEDRLQIAEHFELVHPDQNRTIWIGTHFLTRAVAYFQR